MSNAQDYLAKADEFAGLARKATSLREIREFLERAQSFRKLAGNEEWMTANGDKVISNGTAGPSDHKAGKERK
jgi:hypothetical protein